MLAAAAAVAAGLFAVRDAAVRVREGGDCGQVAAVSVAGSVVAAAAAAVEKRAGLLDAADAIVVVVAAAVVVAVVDGGRMTLTVRRLVQTGCPVGWPTHQQTHHVKT